jgi:hypothetical protein
MLRSILGADLYFRFILTIKNHARKREMKCEGTVENGINQISHGARVENQNKKRKVIG